MTRAIESNTRVNGIDVAALKQVVEEVGNDPSKGLVRFHVRTGWSGQARSEAVVESYMLGGQSIPRKFSIAADEPFELLGTNTAPNPQELLLAALNACMTVGYVAGCAVQGIEIEHLEIESEGELDLRGFLGIDESVPAGYETIHYEVRIKGNGTEEQFRAIHENVIRTSPNYFNMSRPIRLDAHLEVIS